MFVSSNRRGLIVFLGISFGLAWLVWLIAWFANIPATSSTFQFVNLVAGFAPALAAIVVRRWVTHEGFGDAHLALHLRKKWPYYLLAWFLPLLVIAGIILLSTLFRIGQPDFSLNRGLRILYPDMALTSMIGLLLLAQLLFGALLTTPILWGEEFGWRGYMQTRLFPNPLLSAVVTGLIWGVWHYPVILMGYQRYENVYLGLLVFTVLTVFLSIIFGWFYSRTQSIWTSSLAHAATNMIGGSLSTLLFIGSAPLLLVAYHGLLSVIILGGICLLIVLLNKSFIVQSSSEKHKVSGGGAL